MKSNQNPLYPIFLKAHQLKILIVGGGSVGLEKLSFLLKSSPNANVTLLTKKVSPDIIELLLQYPENSVKIIKKAFEKEDVLQHDLVIAATDDFETNKDIRKAAKQHGILVNVADTPALCDFYLGAIVTRGNLKVAISTNGKSPTFAKRFRQLLEATIPEEVDDLLSNLRIVRDQLKGDFSYKVNRLNELTADFLKS